jgi:FtsP/CotA-like multicopper oxidase with cupredoxin domain
MRAAFAAVFSVLGAGQAYAQMAMPAMAPAGSAPHYFSVGNYANSPLPTVSATTTVSGNALVPRQFASAAAAAPGTLAPIFVVVPAPLPAGMLQSFQTYNQTSAPSGPYLSQGNVFHAYVLRPTGLVGQYTVVYDSGLLTIPAPVDPLGEIATFPVPGVTVQAGDVLAFYGQGIPMDVGVGADALSYPAPTPPTQGGVVTLGDTIFPLDPGQYAFSFAATVMDTSPAARIVTGGIRKFVDGLPGLGAAGANNLGQYLPIAAADTTTYPGSDYYEIAVVQYQERMHSDLPPTTLRGYVQLSTPVVPGARVPLVGTDGAPILLPDGTQAIGIDKAHYLGPIIVATKDRPVRILFRNLLPTGLGGNLSIPVDTTVMGAGMGPDMAGMVETDPRNPMCGLIPKPMGCFTENRATLHLHGGFTPWISDGTPHQWVTPAGENTMYPAGVSVKNVPDMPDPGPGAITFFYTNQQSARLMFYHDHAWGITRLNVYAGEAAGYLISDPVEQGLVNAGILPADQIPLIVQDKTFVPDVAQLAAQDPLWDLSRWGGFGQLWLPHVYSPAQNPGDVTGVNAFGRWAYGPWFWPPTTAISYGPVANPYYDPNCNPNIMWCEPPQMPGVPYLSMGMEAFNDTPLVNGTAYPTVTVQPKAYRLRILNAANDRFFNLHFYVADASGKEVALNPLEVAAALADPYGVFPTPDTTVSPPGPSWIQVGTEGGFLPSPVVIPPQHITWVTDPTVFNAGNVDQHSLLLGPAERADVVVDFSAFAGKTLILYNDAPAAFPARDPRYDYYTGHADLTSGGGAPPTEPGYGPNTRTVMQVVVAPGTPAAPYNLAALTTAFKAISLGGQGVFESSQNPIVVGQGEYNPAYGTAFWSAGTRAGVAHIYDTSLTFDTLAGVSLTMPFERKGIHDEMGASFDPAYGRMSGNLGLEVTNPGIGVPQLFVGYPYVNPAHETFAGITLPPGVSVSPISTTTDGTQIWKITHNGVDTHPIHFHLYDVQVLNRVGWDGIIRKVDPNELGWKETVRISPLEDTIVAMRPIVPKLPFGLPESVRPLNPAMPIGSTADFVNIGADGNPLAAPIQNVLTNFGWEYVWHCHILSHEEMDMMRPVNVAVAVAPPATPTATASATATRTMQVDWVDGTPVNYASLADWGAEANEVGYVVERGVPNGAGDVATWSEIARPLANATRFVDATVVPGASYKYRVTAWNAAGSAASTTAAALFPVVPPATGVTVTASPASPQVAGTAVTFTATGQGSSGYQYRFWRSTDGGATYTMVQDWSGAATWTLPATAPTGTYVIVADVRTDPTSPNRDAWGSITFAISATAIVHATGVTLTPSLPSPQQPGTAVTFTAAGQGSSGYQYRFWLSPDNGATWSVVQDWGAVDAWTLPATTPAGTWVVLADVKTDPASTTRDAWTFVSYSLDTAAVAPATGVTLTASAPSPHLAGTDVIFTAVGQGAATYQYRYWLSADGGTTWTMTQDWSPTATWTLPGTTPVGAYLVVADVKSNASATTRDAWTWMSYAIVDTAIVPATGVTLTASPGSPAVAGTAVTFTASGQGSTGYRYRFWLSADGGASWVVAQDWSAGATWTLPSTTPVGTYLVVADVTTDPTGATRDAWTWMSYAVTATALAPATGVVLTASQPSPQIAGTAVVFSAAGQGSTSYQYRFWLSADAGVTFSLVQDWSGTATWTLPATTAAGTYQVVADVKTDPASLLRDAYAWLDYTIVP